MLIKLDFLDGNLVSPKDIDNKAPCGYHSLDSSFVYTNVNNTELGMLGYGRDEVIGKLKFVDLLTSNPVWEYGFIWIESG